MARAALDWDAINQRVLDHLTTTPSTAGDLSKALDIPANHAYTSLRKLEDARKVKVVGTREKDNRIANVWGIPTD